jgi:pimeloyl-ACP methyl ester carboxylesterase
MISSRLAAGAFAAAALGAVAAQAAPAPATETDLQRPGPLAGTLLTPGGGGHGPVALLLSGSGPTDRDGNNPMGVKGGPYKRLAEALAGQGVTTLRVDKRGMFASRASDAPLTDANKVTVADLAADAHAWVADLKTRTGAKCVWLIGHSEGGLVALIAAQNPKDICGLVIIAGPGRRLSDVIREQLKANPANAPLLPDAMAAIDALEAGKDVDVSGFHPALKQLFAPQIQPFLKVMFSYDPADLAKAYKGPLLILQGTTDIQINMADAERLQAAHPGATLIRLEGVNHVLRLAPADRAANAATYGDETAPLAPGVAVPIAAFLKSHR